MKTVVYIDHYDSFADMLIDYIKQLGFNVIRMMTDHIDINQIQTIQPDHIVIGPGPGSPDDVSLQDVYSVIKCFYRSVPILGICLGHQILGVFYGAAIKRLPKVRHGVVSSLTELDMTVFQQLPYQKADFQVTRYHSLMLDNQTINQARLMITCTCVDDGVRIIMGIKDVALPVYGFQFHPEAIMTNFGLELCRYVLGNCSR